MLFNQLCPGRQFDTPGRNLRKTPTNNIEYRSHSKSDQHDNFSCHSIFHILCIHSVVHKLSSFLIKCKHKTISHRTGSTAQKWSDCAAKPKATQYHLKKNKLSHIWWKFHTIHNQRVSVLNYILQEFHLGSGISPQHNLVERARLSHRAQVPVYILSYTTCIKYLVMFGVP
jgi:hypothetical protein